MITSLGEERANHSGFRSGSTPKYNKVTVIIFNSRPPVVRFVRFELVWFCLFPLPLDVWEGLRLVIMAFPGLFSYLFFCISEFGRLWQKLRCSYRRRREGVRLGEHMYLYYKGFLASFWNGNNKYASAQQDTMPLFEDQ